MEIIYSTYVVATDGTGQHCIEVRDDGDGTGYVWDVHQQRRINGTAFGNVPRAELDRVIEGYERYHAERRAAQATALAASGVEVGDRVEAGEPGTEDHDTGNVRTMSTIIATLAAEAATAATAGHSSIEWYFRADGTLVEHYVRDDEMSDGYIGEAYLDDADPHNKRWAYRITPVIMGERQMDRQETGPL